MLTDILDRHRRDGTRFGGVAAVAAGREPEEAEAAAEKEASARLACPRWAAMPICPVQQVEPEQIDALTVVARGGV